MHHGIDAGGSSDVRRQAIGKLRVQKRNVRQDHGRNHAHLLVCPCGDDGDRRHFRAGTCRGRHQNEREPGTFGVSDTVNLRQRLLAGRNKRNQFGDIKGRTSTEPDHTIDCGLPRFRGSGKNDMFRRVGFHIAEKLDSDPGIVERIKRPFDQTGCHHARIGYKHDTASNLAGYDFAELIDDARTEADRLRCIERERVHDFLHIGLVLQRPKLNAVSTARTKMIAPVMTRIRNLSLSAADWSRFNRSGGS